MTNNPTNDQVQPGKDSPQKDEPALDGCMVLILIIFFLPIGYVAHGVYFWFSEMSVANSLNVTYRNEVCGLGFNVTEASPGKTTLRLYTVCEGSYGDGFKKVTRASPSAPVSPKTPSVQASSKKPEQAPAKPERSATIEVSLEKLGWGGQTHAAEVSIFHTPKPQTLVLNVVRGVEAGYSKRSRWNAQYWYHEIEISLKAEGGVSSAIFRPLAKPK